MNAVVCYPYIEPNQEWLTIAALCWDHVHRITSAHAPPDSPGIRKLDSAINGLLRSVYPEQVVTPDIERLLREWLAARKDRVSREQRIAGVEETASRNAEEGFLLFHDKIPSQSLGELFYEYGVIRQQKEQIQAPWWMHEYYRGLTGEWVGNRKWKPSGGTAA